MLTEAGILSTCGLSSTNHSKGCDIPIVTTANSDVCTLAEDRRPADHVVLCHWTSLANRFLCHDSSSYRQATWTCKPQHQPATFHHLLEAEDQFAES
jgi:hypothetical protein